MDDAAVALGSLRSAAPSLCESLLQAQNFLLCAHELALCSSFVPIVDLQHRSLLPSAAASCGVDDLQLQQQCLPQRRKRRHQDTEHVPHRTAGAHSDSRVRRWLLRERRWRWRRHGVLGSGGSGRRLHALPLRALWLFAALVRALVRSDLEGARHVPGAVAGRHIRFKQRQRLLRREERPAPPRAWH